MPGDYVESHNRLLDLVPNNRMVEFGLGEGTQYFLNRFNKVVSVEFFSPDQNIASKYRISNDYWMDHFKKEFSSYSNWEVVGIPLGEEILKAEEDITGVGELPRGSDPRNDYKTELHALLDEFFSKQEPFDFAFVDAGIHLRGDIVNYLFGKVLVISAHDFKDAEKVYGYHRIVVPDSYRQEDGERSAEGTMFWISKEIGK